MSASRWRSGGAIFSTRCARAWKSCGFLIKRPTDKAPLATKAGFDAELIPTGIGRPADKHASHMFPRDTLGTAREAGVVNLVAMRAMLANLEKPFGFSGAISQLLQALRSGELTGICDQFHGLNASNRPLYEMPDQARNFVLPMPFWGHAQWHDDGETSVQVANQPFDRWIFKSDWRKGNFSVSGSFRRGQLFVVRRVNGVRLRKAEADAFLAKRGIVPLLPANRRLDHDKIIGMAVDLRKAKSGISKGKAALSIISELGDNPKTGKRFDNRHIERIIGVLWTGDSESPP